MSRKLLKSSAFCLIYCALLLTLIIFGMRDDTPSYDGALNFQVSRNLSEKLIYDPLSHNIRSIQTSSVFLYSAAAILKIFGISNIIFLISSGIYIAFLWVVISKISRQYFNFLNEVFIVLWFGLGGVPFFYKYGFGGFGEFIGVGFALLGLYLTALACRSSFLTGVSKESEERTTGEGGRFLLAGMFIGIAISIKWVFFLAYAAAFVFLFLVQVVWRGSELFLRRGGEDVDGDVTRARSRIFLQRSFWLTGGVMISVAIHSLLLAVFLWGENGFKDYVAKVASGIAAQGGVSDRFEDSTGLVEKIDVHSDILATQIGLGRPFLLFAFFVLLIVFFVSLAILFKARLALNGRSSNTSEIEFLKHTKALNVALINVVILTYGFGHVLWWLAVTPTQKAWDRRVAVGVLCLNLVLLLNAVLLLNLVWLVWKNRRNEGRKKSGAGRFLYGSGVAALFMSLVVGPLGSFKFVNPLDVPKAASAIRLRNSTQVEWAQHLNFLEGLEARGLSAYGSGWKRSPRSSLYSGTPVLDVSETSPRDLLSADKLVLVGEPLSYPNLVAFSGFSLRPNLKQESKKWGRFWHEELTPVSPTNEALYLSLIRQITDGLALERNSCGSGGGLGAGFEVLAGAYGQEAGGRWLSGASHLLLSRECFDQGNDPLSIYWPSEASSSQQLDIYFSDGSCIESLNLLIAPGKLGSIRYGDLMESCKGDVGVLSVYAEQVMSDGRQLGAYLVDGA